MDEDSSGIFDSFQEDEFPGDFENRGQKKLQKVTFLFPVIAHNMQGYDSHIILKYLTREFPEEEIRVIVNNQEKYIAFDIGPFRFIANSRMQSENSCQ